MAGDAVYPADSPAVRIGCADSRDFTAWELEILRELALGHKYETIAAGLGISPNTVKYHVKNLLQKTGYDSACLELVEMTAGGGISAAPLPGRGVAARLGFRSLLDENSQVELFNAFLPDSGGRNLPVQVTNGQITVPAPADPPSSGGSSPALRLVHIQNTLI